MDGWVALRRPTLHVPGEWKGAPAAAAPHSAPDSKRKRDDVIPSSPYAAVEHS